MDLYRLKLILEDGRRVYASKRGQIELSTKKLWEQLLPEVMNFAYTKDLSMFSTPDLLQSMNLPYVRVVGVKLEPSSYPIDSNVFIPGVSESGNSNMA